jgi:heptaprenyl diphosphate synthase
MTSAKTPTAYSSDFQVYCEEVRCLVDSKLQSLLPELAELRLRKQIEYALNTKGKRLRSVLVLLSGESVGARRDQLQTLALAVELLHLATLVHDDILDEDMFRRNYLSVYGRWGVKEAVLVGDILGSLSLSICKEYRREILDVLIDACIQLSDGEYSDVKSAAASLNEKDYFDKIGKKCASLFKAACECGTLAAHSSPIETNTLRLYGWNYGIAYQIRDDILDAEASANDLQPDVNKFRVTLPIIHAFESASREKQELLQQLLSQRTQESLSVFIAELRFYLGNGSLDYCGGKADEFIDRAIASLAPLKESVFKGYLKEMAEQLRIRAAKSSKSLIVEETRLQS